MSSFTSVVETTIIFFHSVSDSWPLAIAMLAVVVKLILLPIQVFNSKQQRLMAKIQPEIDQLSKTYKEDPKMLFQKISEVRKREGVKVGWGLLTSLVQIPVFISIYRAFMVLGKTFTGGFVWVSSLAVPDPFFIFPFLVAAGSYVQQRLAPDSKAMKPEMNQFMKWMPVVSFLLMLSLPSGLAFYYAISGILNIAGDVIRNNISDAL